MKINNLSLPHPVLGLNDDILGKYEPQLQVTLARDKITMDVQHVLMCEDIQSRIASGEAAFCVELNCTKTIYRNSFISQDANQKIEVPSDLLRDRVAVSFFIIAIKEILNYAPKEAHPDYRDYRFVLNVGDVMGVGEGDASFMAEKDWVAAKTVSSFIAIIPGNEQAGPMDIDLSDSKVIVRLSKDDYQRYANSRESEYAPIFHSAIVLPVLTYAVSEMILDENVGIYENKKWCQVLNDFKENDERFRAEAWDTSNAPRLAQMILDNPLNRTLSTIQQQLGKDDQ